ncbi:MAG: Mur ligase family protein [Micropepsaceae bacterium]
MILNQASQYFFCGIGGSGMLPLALILKGKGFEVEGSDRALDQGRLAEKFDFLRSAGIRLHPQDGSGITRTSQVLVASAAVENTIPDVAAAKKLGLSMVRRAELLAELFNSAPMSVAIGGTSGKSTTTGMAGWIFHDLGMQPTIMNGAVMKNFANTSNTYASSAVGQGTVFVSEVDESDGSISLYNPKIALVTNVSLDHKPLTELRELFGAFISRAETAILNLDNPETANVKRLAKRVLTFSIADAAADILANDIRLFNVATEFRVHEKSSGQDILCRIQLPGRHNVSNALGALACAIAAGVPAKAACEAISRFSGIKRRFDIVGTAGSITVIDDFAHNPDKIAATFNTLHEFPGRIIVMFQPHGYGPLKLMGHELVASFSHALASEDLLVMPDPAYYGGTTIRDVGSADIVKGVIANGKNAVHEPNRADCMRLLTDAARPGDRIVIMGARDDTLSEFAHDVLRALSIR